MRSAKQGRNSPDFRVARSIPGPFCASSLAGSLYPALRRLEADGLIHAEWKMSEHNRRARYYHLTKASERRLADVLKRWRQHSAAVSTFLEFA
jgi:DNA-binding PadR family transcriptional regulator